MAEEPRESLEAVRLEKLRRIAEPGDRPVGRRFDGHQAIADGPRAGRCPRPEGGAEPPGPTVRVAGRIMLRRGQGKVVFLELRDWTERIQVFVGKKQVGDAGWSLVELLDLGDLIGVDGTLGYTKTGELTVFAEALTFLAKSLLPPPEKWHGLTDLEQRYRQRYVDLFSNPESLADLPRPLEDHRVVPQDHGRAGASSRSRRPRCRRSPAGRRPGRSSRITTRSTSTCSCGSRPSCT